MPDRARPLVLVAPGPARLAREDVAASQRGRMLRAMAEAAAEKGYANTAVADVVARAGVSRKTFYEHFENKEACFLAAYDATVDALYGAVADEAGEPQPFEDQIRRLLRVYLDMLAADPQVAYAYLIAVYAAGPAALARRRAVVDRFAAMFADLHARTGAAPLPALRYEALVGAISSIVTVRVATGEAHRLPELLDELVALVRDTLG
jgi:AcrR family transcriptional regulator